MRVISPSRRRLVLAVLGFVLGAAAIAAPLIASGAFSATQVTTPVATQQVSSGAIHIGLTGTASAESITVPAPNLAPGDTVTRAVLITNTGTAPFGGVTMSLTAPPGSLTGAVSWKAQTCSAAWVATSLADGGWSYSCPGTSTTVASGTGPAAAPMPLPAPFIGLAPGKSEPLAVTFTVPTSIGNSAQGSSMQVSYSFAATQVGP